MKRLLAAALLAAALVAPQFSQAQSADATQDAAKKAEISIERNVAMKTRDGVTLHADVYRPAGDGKFPVLLQRTPYDRSNTEVFARKAVARGFMVVAQDVRGRYGSEGDWYPFKHESEDGFDAVEWAAALPHSDGRVGMFGGSYVGATQMLAAVAHPPHLAGICPIVTASNYHENWTYQGGALQQWFDQSWTSGLAQDTLNRFIGQGTNAMIGATTLPLKKYPLFNVAMEGGATGLSELLAPYYLDWIEHPSYDDYWRKWSIEEQYSQIQVPALTVAAWYDIFLPGSLKNYIGLHAGAGNEQARANQRLLITVGGHAGNTQKIGDVDFGTATNEYDEDELIIRWYEHLFKGVVNEYTNPKKPVRLFVMGANQWRSEESWPLKRAIEAHYYLHGGAANSASGNGVLSTHLPQAEKPDSFLFDPANPVPTVGGPLCCDGNHLEAGPKDQHELEKRRDVLVYSTAPLEDAVEVTGPVSLELWVKSSTVDTDITGKLVDVWPNGFVQNLSEGILRLRYRDGNTEAHPMQPGKVYQIKVDLAATSNLFQKGHRIRLEVSSSNFPRFDRNLNTGKSAANDAAFVKSMNVVLHDAAHPSAVLLPIVGK